jgi:hypothetical protein
LFISFWPWESIEQIEAVAGLGDLSDQRGKDPTAAL